MVSLAARDRGDPANRTLDGRISVKKLASLLVLFSLGMFTVGCGDTTAPPPATPATPPATTPDEGAPGDATPPPTTPEGGAAGEGTTPPPGGENQ
jgi:hypothetical protein